MSPYTLSPPRVVLKVGLAANQVAWYKTCQGAFDSHLESYQEGEMAIKKPTTLKEWLFHKEGSGGAESSLAFSFPCPISELSYGSDGLEGPSSLHKTLGVRTSVAREVSHCLTPVTCHVLGER